jgi:hypothetical protein
VRTGPFDLAPPAANRHTTQSGDFRNSPHAPATMLPCQQSGEESSVSLTPRRQDTVDRLMQFDDFAIRAGPTSVATTTMDILAPLACHGRSPPASMQNRARPL